MLSPLARWVGLVACVSAACAGHHEPSPAPSPELELDASAVQPSRDASAIDDDPRIDGMPRDAARPDTPAPQDAGIEPVTFAAVRGQRCDIREMVGLVWVIKDAPPYEDFIARAVVAQLRSPFVPELSITRGACRHYDEPMRPMCSGDCAASGLACVGDDICGVWPPEFDRDARVTLSNGSASQLLSVLADTHPVELEGALSVRIELGRYVVTLDATAIPEPIAGLEVVRNDQGSGPESIDIRWPAPVEGHVYAYSFAPLQLPIGAFERYTECIADGAALEMPIEQDVLAPFGGHFEFQGVDHVYFAAATTPAGCVEIRYIYRYWHDRPW